ncbi:MAG: branched-chain amino acid aminotransferase [Bdellovibrionota bacterium]
MSLNAIDELLPISQLGFGKYYGKYMVEAVYKDGEWKPWTVSDLHRFEMHPGSKTLHYAQEIFEGLKAYKQPSGIHMFRPEANIRRMSLSAEALAMPSYPEDQFMDGLKALVAKLAHLTPDQPGSLYLRPTMIGNSNSLGVAPASEYLFYILACPVGGYFGDVVSDKPSTISIWISDKHVRAAPGGLGAAKTGANYAASLRAVAESKKLGFTNVMFLDATQRRYLEELSGMNVFVVEDGILKTPPLGDTILAGVTRDSIIKIAKHLRIPVQETPIAVDEMLKGLVTGKTTEVFACGTASVITSIAELGWRGERVRVGNGQAGPIASQLYATLTAMHSGAQAGLESDWLVKCK